MNDYLLERRLKEEAPQMHRLVADSLISLQALLESFFTWFPDFTDHSILHSMDVLYYCNQLIGDQVWELSISECYVLVMACYLHDVGMGISRGSFEQMVRQIDLAEYRLKHPDAGIPKIIRDFHNEFSGLFIRKNAALFDIPSETLLFAIIQVSRGHRKTDLYDETEYPDLRTPDGMIRTAYLAALLRLADELDVAADRNPEILFDTSTLTQQRDIDAFGTHESIREVEVTEEAIILYIRLKEARFEGLVRKLAKKIQSTLDYCREVTEQRSDLHITQKRVVLDYPDITNT